MCLLVLAADRDAVDARFAFLEEARDLEALAPRVKKAQDAARKILFDNRRYPVPAQARRGWRVGIDRQPGHAAMERAVAAAIVQHNKAVDLVAAKLGVPTRLIGGAQPTRRVPARIKPVQQYGILVIDNGLLKFLGDYRIDYEAWGAKPKGDTDRLLHAVGALAQSKWGNAAARGRRLNGAERLVWDVLIGGTGLVWNAKHKAKHNEREASGMLVLNAYRLSLGLHPLILDGKLHHMARDFASEMTRLNFFSHYHPHPSRRTVRDRARRVGYTSKLAENVSSEGNGALAMWQWRADAGHHRVLVMPVFRAAGLGCARPSVLNVGSTGPKITSLYR